MVLCLAAMVVEVIYRWKPALSLFDYTGMRRSLCLFCLAHRSRSLPHLVPPKFPLLRHGLPLLATSGLAKKRSNQRLRRKDQKRRLKRPMRQGQKRVKELQQVLENLQVRNSSLSKQR